VLGRGKVNVGREEFTQEVSRLRFLQGMNSERVPMVTSHAHSRHREVPRLKKKEKKFKMIQLITVKREQ
jgi:hypothetical protein